MKTITELTITRSKWLRGEGGSQSRLFRPSDAKMCCLGFFGAACGLTNADMEDIGEPSELEGIGCPEQLDSGENWSRNETVQKLIEVNDLQSVDDAYREAEITKLMLQLDPPVKVTFVD